MDGEIANGNALLSTSKERATNDAVNKAVTVGLCAAIIILIQLCVLYYFITFSTIDGTSMQNTLEDGQCVLLSRRFTYPTYGDIVTVNTANGGQDHILIKRVVAMENDRLLFVRDRENKVCLYLCKDGEQKYTKLDEPYIKEPMSWTYSTEGIKYEKVSVIQQPEQNIEEIELDKQSSDQKTEAIRLIINGNSYYVPEGSFFFLGDNRNNSQDSRHYGARKYSDITGKVICILQKDSFGEKVLRFIYGSGKKQ